MKLQTYFMPSITMLFKGILCGVCVLSVSIASAQPAESNGRKGPPPQALDACKSLALGAECGFSGAQGTIKGTCLASEGRSLACRPKNAPAPATPASAQQR
jgi:hypothetical protein